MALSIGVFPSSAIRIGQSILVVKEILDSKTVSITIDGGPPQLITEDKRTLILPDVYVFCGMKVNKPGVHESRLAFEAPRRIAINRI